MTAADPEFPLVSDRQAARERALRVLAVIVGALFLAFGALGAGFVWYDYAAGWVSHTHRVRTALSTVLLDLTEAEAAQRGYLLAGDAAFAAQARTAVTAARAEIAEVRRLTRDNPAQQARIDALVPLVESRVAILERNLEVRRAGPAAPAAGIVGQAAGAAAMNAVRGQVAELDRTEAGLEADRAGHASLIRSGLIFALVVFAALLAILFIRALRDLELDRRAEEATADQLRDLLAERTLLLEEVNHRVKNSLQQIASVVRLQSRSAHPEAREALDKTLARIMAVGRVHEQLYKTTGEVGRFDAGVYAQALAEELVASMGRDDIRLETMVEPARLDLRQAVPLALILNELITNALKYGCPAETPGKIRVAFGTEGDGYRLSVADQGAGLPPGFTVSGGQSLGLRAVAALAGQLRGRLIVEPREVGAEFAVEFPRQAV